ncbi:hypothetical protein BME99_19345 [Pseudomonas protegens]|nr:hypothetical protein BME99_19345 [Pseudomonas protegens]
MPAQGIEQTGRLRHHRLDLQGVAHHYNALGAHDGTNGRLRRGLTGFVDDQPTQVFSFKAGKLRTNRGESTRHHRGQHKQPLP